MVPVLSTWERRSDLDGATLVNTVLPWSPVIIVGEEMALSGLMPDVLIVLQAAMNFR